MALEDNYKYYVIQFLEQPYDDIDEYVCVPKSWIQLCYKIDQETLVAYPSEKSLDTKDKVKKEKKIEVEWKFYSAIVKYSTDLYREAQSFINTKSSNRPKENASSMTGSKGDKMKPAVNKKPRHSRRSAFSNAKVVKSKTKGSQLKSNRDAPKRLLLKRPISQDLLKGELNRKRTKIIQETQSAMKVSTFDSKPVEWLKELLSVLEDSSDVESRSQEISVKTPTTVISVDDKARCQSHTKNETSDNPANMFLQSLGLTNRDNHLSSQNKTLPKVVIEKMAKVHGTDEKPRPESATENGISTVSTSSATANKPCQLLEYLSSKNPSSVQERHVPVTVNGKRNESTGINQCACPKICTGNTTAAQSSTGPVNQLFKYFHENQSSLHYRETVNPDPQVQERLTQRAAELRSMAQSVEPLRSTTITPAMQNTPNLMSQSRQSLEQLYQNYPSLNYADYVNGDRRIQELLARGSAGTSTSDEKAYLQSHTKNTTPGMLNYPNLTNLPWQTCGSAQKTPFYTANNPFFYQDPNERQILIQKSAEANVHDQRACSQHNQQNTSAMQTFENVINPYSLLPPHAQGMQPASVNRNYTHQDPRKQKRLDRRSTEVNYVGQRACPQGIMHNTPAPASAFQNPANSTNHLSQLYAYSHEKRHPTVHKDFLKQDLGTSTAIATGSTGMANKVPNQNIKQNAPTVQSLPIAVDHLYQSAECSYGNNFSSVLKHCVQDSHLEKNVARKTIGRNPMDVRANFPANTQNTAPNVPYFLHLPNQFSQSFERLNEAPFPSIRGNNLLQDPRLQPILHSGLTEINSTNQRAFPQSIPQNIPPSPQDPSNAVKRSCCSCNCSNEQQPSTITSDLSHQNPRVQETPAAGSTEGNSMDQNGYHSSTEKRPSATESFANAVNQSSEYPMEGQSSLMHVSSSDQVPPTTEIPAEKLNDGNDTEQNTTSKTAIQSSLSASDHKSPDIRAAIEHLLVEQLTNMFQKMQSSISKNIELFDRERTALMNYNEMLEKVINTLNRSCKLKNDYAVASTSKNTTEKSKKVTDKKENEKNNEEKYNLDDDDDDDSDYSNDDDDDENNIAVDDRDDDYNADGDIYPQAPPKKNRDRRQSFTLPPEYNAKNPRWTLKHQRASTGIIEIMPRTRVYIDAIYFANCKRMSRDHKTFARMLLSEIFSQSALSVCSLTGARANAFTVDGTNIRPGLDENARTVLFRYVEQYGRERGWGPYDTQAVVKSVRSKIREIRSKNSLVS